MAIKPGDVEFWFTLTVEFYSHNRASWSYMSGTFFGSPDTTMSDVFNHVSAQMLEQRNGVFQKTDMKVVFFDVRPNAILPAARVEATSTPKDV